MATQRLLAHCSYASWSIAALRSFVCTRGAGREGGGRWSERTLAEGYLVGCGCGDWATRCWQNSLRRRMSDISTLSTWHISYTHTHLPHTHTHMAHAHTWHTHLPVCTFAATFLACKPLCGLMWHFAHLCHQCYCRYPSPLLLLPSLSLVQLPVFPYAAILLLVFHLTEANFGITTHFFTFASLTSKQIIIVVIIESSRERKREREQECDEGCLCFMRKLNFQSACPHPLLLPLPLCVPQCNDG